MNDSELDALIRPAGARPPVPDDFIPSVWRRIENEEAAIRLHPGMANRRSPWAAAAGLAAAIALGAWFGMASRPSGDHAKADYVRSISPFARHLSP